ncbi:MAG: dTMP kinase [Christensenellales bacterium]|jgi:dTMP kinase
MHGLFIVFEGPDGVGKTTQAQMLAKRLAGEGHDVVMTREPGGCRISEKIRDIILDNANSEMEDITEAMLYAAARAQHVAEVIKPALNMGKTVICDRFVHSSIVYQGYARGLGEENVLKINKPALLDVWPDIVIVLNMDAEKAMLRLSGGRDRLENAGEAFHYKVSEGFSRAAEAEPRALCFNAVLDVDTLSQSIYDNICRVISKLKGVPL